MNVKRDIITHEFRLIKYINLLQKSAYLKEFIMISNPSCVPPEQTYILGALFKILQGA